MLEGFLTWLGTLPPGAIYATIAFLAALENFVPPFPADTAIALGAFLSHRGLTDPVTVYLVTLVANIAGATAVYYIAARHSSWLFNSGFARRFLPDDGLAFVRTEYQRFGLLGLFIGRLLPGFRAIVPAFAGLIHIGPLKAGIAMAVASAIWYGGVIYLATVLGARFDDIVALIGRINSTLGIVALVVATIVGVLLWRAARRRKARHEAEAP